MSPCWAEARLANRKSVQVDASSANFLNTNPSSVRLDYWSSPGRRMKPGEAAAPGDPAKRLGRPESAAPVFGPPSIRVPQHTKTSEHPWREGLVVTDGVSD